MSVDWSTVGTLRCTVNSTSVNKTTNLATGATNMGPYNNITTLAAVIANHGVTVCFDHRAMWNSPCMRELLKTFDVQQALSTLPHCNVTVVPYHLDLKAPEVTVRTTIVGDGDGEALGDPERLGPAVFPRSARMSRGRSNFSTGMPSVAIVM